MLVRRACWLAALVGVAGCYAKVNNSGHSSSSGVDASAPPSGVDASPGGGGGGGGTIDAPPMPSPDAPPPPARRVVYLNFEGVTLTSGATTDATQNQAHWLGVLDGLSNVTIPPYLPNDTDRATKIATVVTTVTQILQSAVPTVSVVTTRPAAGPYTMVVFGGSPGLLNTGYIAETDHDCGDAFTNDIGWVSQSNLNLSAAGNYAVGAIGWALGLDGTTSPSDCMCSWQSNCTQNTTMCTLATSINSAAQGTACHTGAQDEVGAFQTAYGP